MLTDQSNGRSQAAFATQLTKGRLPSNSAGRKRPVHGQQHRMQRKVALPDPGCPENRGGLGLTLAAAITALQTRLLGAAAVAGFRHGAAGSSPRATHQAGPRDSYHQRKSCPAPPHERRVAALLGTVKR